MSKGNKRYALPLIEEIKEVKDDLFDDQFNWDIPDYLKDNLIHTLRYYQEEAVWSFHLTQTSNAFKYRDMNHLLFHMATGSGKTDLMASLILYLYEEQGYQNFLFTVNTKSVLNKTIENLIDKTSSKYLYSEEIEINHSRIFIEQVEVFPKYPSENTIYIKLGTIQSIASDLYTQKENTMGAAAYAENKLVVLGDEAHHYSASTKSEKETEQSWENAINTVLSARDDNLLLEFTATINLENKNIYEKYKDKVVYQYALDRYISDKYSKNIKRIQSNNSDKGNMLNVILLSEFRRRLARERYDTFMKPVILFKSQRIADSNEAEEQFKEVVENLSVDTVKNFIARQRQLNTLEESETLELAYTYYEKNEDRLLSIIQDMKREFNPNRIINANDSSQSGILDKGQYEALNNLESPNNLYRVIFAVAKLTEGWDVLNLFDIVRLSDAPKTSGTKNTTNSEAQLIGRGARYYPFELDGNSSYQRRFEDDSMSNLLLETLHYHTINEPQYLKNLIASLDDMNLPTGVDEKNPLLDVKVKPSFKRTDTYKKGKIYYNDVVDVPDSYYDGLNKYGIDNKQDIVIPWLKVTRELSYKAGFRVDEADGTHNVPVIINRHYLTKAFARNKFYHFKNIKEFLPQLNSMEEFLDEEWLNIKKRTLYANVPIKITRNDLSPIERLSILETYLDEIEQKIKNGYHKQKGTSRFIGYPIKDYIVDYRKRVPNYDTANYFAPQFVDRYPIEEDFFAYKHAVINRTEKDLVDRIKERIPELEEKYDNVYLIRMDENMHRESGKEDKLKLHQFDKNPDEIHYSGFQPDFVLLIDDSDYYIQIFIEPKAEGRYNSEKWKEDILRFINKSETELIIDDEINNVKIKGLKFYFMNDTNDTMQQLGEMTIGNNFKGLSIEEL